MLDLPLANFAISTISPTDCVTGASELRVATVCASVAECSSEFQAARSGNSGCRLKGPPMLRCRAIVQRWGTGAGVPHLPMNATLALALEPPVAVGIMFRGSERFWEPCYAVCYTRPSRPSPG
jgi:hypothetical protein